jgi:hypothetical protein
VGEREHRECSKRVLSLTGPSAVLGQAQPQTKKSRQVRDTIWRWISQTGGKGKKDLTALVVHLDN